MFWLPIFCRTLSRNFNFFVPGLRGTAALLFRNLNQLRSHFWTISLDRLGWLRVHRCAASLVSVGTPSLFKRYWRFDCHSKSGLNERWTNKSHDFKLKQLILPHVTSLLRFGTIQSGRKSCDDEVKCGEITCFSFDNTSQGSMRWQW
jgi:hypothetical protein